MSSQVSLFQVVVLAAFMFFAVFGVLVFSGIIPLFSGVPTGVGGEVTIWGTFPQAYLRDLIDEVNKENDGVFRVVYVEKLSVAFDQELVNALASGVGPDLILLPQNLIVRHRDKVLPIPYGSFSVRDFKDMFIEGGELYLDVQGALGLPFSVDPMVMYWNRDMFGAASLSQPPRFWDEFFTLVPKLTKTDITLNVLESAVALGEFRNIFHAKDIVAMLILQSGNPIVEKKGNTFVSVLSDDYDLSQPPAQSALRFYTEFSNPAKKTYSWNRSLPSSKNMFIAGDLAVYFGFASEYRDIKSKSPHLNFDIAQVPQTREAGRELTFGNLSSLAVLKSSDNILTAYHAVSVLTSPQFLQVLSLVSLLPPTRRDLLAAEPPDDILRSFYKNAVITRGWYDPSPSATALIFQAMVENVISGQERLSEAIVRSEVAIEGLLPVLER